MKTEKLIKCPACDSSHVAWSTAVKDYYFSNETFDIWACSNCKLRFTQNRPAADSIGTYYDSSNYASHDSETKPTLFLKIYQLARDYMLNQKYRLLRDYKPERHKALDYGTGEGYFTEFLTGKGIDAHGIEPSEVARTNFSKRTGRTLFKSLDEVESGQKFQSISLWHVLEHIHTLKETMNDLVSRLDQNGVMLIAVPNQQSKDLEIFGQYWAAWDVPRHLYHWDIESLTRFMESLGLQNVHVGQLPLDPFYIGIISSKYAATGPLSGIWNGLKSYLHGRSVKTGGSTLLTVWMKK